MSTAEYKRVFTTRLLHVLHQRYTQELADAADAHSSACGVHGACVIPDEKYATDSANCTRVYRAQLDLAVARDRLDSAIKAKRAAADRLARVDACRLQLSLDDVLDLCQPHQCIPTELVRPEDIEEVRRQMGG